jgi:hypothetical protein
MNFAAECLDCGWKVGPWNNRVEVEVAMECHLKIPKNEKHKIILRGGDLDKVPSGQESR